MFIKNQDIWHLTLKNVYLFPLSVQSRGVYFLTFFYIATIIIGSFSELKFNNNTRSSVFIVNAINCVMRYQGDLMFLGIALNPINPRLRVNRQMVRRALSMAKLVDEEKNPKKYLGALYT